MRIVPTVNKFPGATPVYRETRGPVLDLEAEVGAEGCAIFLSQREVAQALSTRGVLDWERVREVLEAQGWASPEQVAESLASVDAVHNELAAERDAAVAERDTLVAANQIKAARQKVAKAAA